MKVMHVIPDLSPKSGGPSRSVPALCQHLARCGVDVCLVAGRNEDADGPDEPEAPGVNVLEFQHDRHLTVERGLKRLLTQQAGQADLVHIHSIWNATSSTAAAAARQMGVPYLIAPRGMLHAHCLRRSRWKKRAYWWLVERASLRHAAGLHFLNKAERDGARLGATAGKPTFVVPNGVDADGLSRLGRGAFRAQHPFLRDRRILLFFGRLHPIKNLPLQMEAFALLAHKMDDLVWVLAGPDDGEWAAIRARSRALGLEDRVLWTGMLAGERRFSALADADVVLMTSHYECHSMTVNEALAIGRPILITHSCNFDEVAEVGAGCAVDSDAEQVAAGIERILGSPALASQMSEAGRRFAGRRLDWPRVARRMLEAYRSLVAG